ncbi:MAG: DUF5056 domain-containing protein [Prevotella sp.]|nr:DUF5056 domain-containing protein [Prevotella sp.]
MTEDNDLLLQQFFSNAAQQQIEDNGFTERVMQRLPSRINWFSRLWTMFCIVVFAVLFVVFHGWELLAVQLEVLLRTWTIESVSFNPLMLAIVLFGLLFVGVGEVALKMK